MSKKYDLVVVGGGLAGICAAISAARLGCEVALVQDRSVLGGNSSSEIRVPVAGCDFIPWARETGIIEELLITDRVRNHNRIWCGLVTSIWDLVLYEAVKKEKKIGLFLDTSARDVTLFDDDNKKIKEIRCSQSGTEKELILKADMFVDATGDGTIAYKAGAETRMGRESRKEFNEMLAPINADNCTQGSSLFFHAIDLGHPVPFILPEGISEIPDYPTDNDLPFRTHIDPTAGYWWIELGFPPFNTITDNEKIRYELIRQLLGVWNHIKNHGSHGAENLVLDWIGAVPGKRESRRIVGDYILNENDLKKSTLFNDRVAYGGWFIDIHTPGGILAKDKPPEPTSLVGKEGVEELEKRHVYIYSIPFRCLYSKDICNLLMAGRQISVTHVALGSTRIMGTCAVMGQAVGTAAYLCKHYNVFPKDIYSKHIKELQQLLLKQDCYIPSVRNEEKEDLAKKAKIVVSSSAMLTFGEGKIGEVFEVPRQRYFCLSNLQNERAQLFPVSADRIDYVELLLESKKSIKATVEISLKKAKNIWDFNNSETLKTIKSSVSLNGVSWAKFKIEQSVEPNKLYWISVKSNDELFWRYCDYSPTGTVSASRIINRWTLQYGGSYSIHIFPDCYPYGAENILNGVTRPEEWTNIWVSNPYQGFPQYVELDFGKEIIFNNIYLIFDTNLSRTRVSTPPLFKAPECVKDYSLFFYEYGNWKQFLEIKGNYNRRCIHHFNEINSKKLRIEIISTNGDPSARIYEIRIYHTHNFLYRM